MSKNAWAKGLDLNALNDAGWEFLANCPENFYPVKPALAAAIRVYLENEQVVEVRQSKSSFIFASSSSIEPFINLPENEDEATEMSLANADLGPSTLRDKIVRITTMLENREWADDLLEDDEDVLDLRGQISILIGSVNGWARRAL